MSSDPTPAVDVATMIGLCVASYAEPPSSIDVSGVQPAQTIVWGPAWKSNPVSGESYTLMYVTNTTGTDEYTVVARGTNPESWTSWHLEDFDVATTQPLQGLVPGAPADARVSTGSYNGLNDLIGLVDATSTQDVATFLGGVGASRLYVTGHSLGGTLVPPLFCYLSGAVPALAGAMTPFSFAGLTAGDDRFNTYFTGLFDASTAWRYHNTLDIAPNLWWSGSNVENIYVDVQPGKSLHWHFPEKDVLEKLFAEAAPNGYRQPPGGGVPLTGIFDDSFPERDSWLLQAMYQHHSTTYQTLLTSPTQARKSDAVPT